MHQIVVQHFELESIPQPAPGAAEYSIHKLAPQLHKVVDLGHVLVYAVAHRPSSWRERIAARSSILILPCWTDDLAVSTQDWSYVRSPEDIHSYVEHFTGVHDYELF